jgi:ribose/xylose/arabinose/galactoside ABC-type transport system permease subunit
MRIIPLLVAAVVTMAVAQLLDLASFGLMMRQVGVRAEANPLVAALYATWGLRAVVIAKVAVLALVTAIVAVLATAPSARLRASIVAAVLVVAIAAGVVGGASNTVAMGLLG